MAPRFSKNGKRLGRPPKNAAPASTTFSLGSNHTTQEVAPVLTQEPVVSNFDKDTMIECEFVPVAQYTIVNTPDSPTKSGFYTSSCYRMEDRDAFKWPALAYLKADFDKYRASEIPDKEILQRCINYLNSLDLKKVPGKKDPVSRYGKLSLSKEEIKFTKKFGFECAILIFCTDERKCEHFWGTGERYQ
jgi:hypothetical protein